MRFIRTPRLIRQSDPELYHLTLLHTGSVAIGQSGLANVHGPGGMYFIDCSRPFACRMGGRFTGICLEIPKALIPPLVADLVTRSLTEHQGIGRLLVGFLTQLSACEASYRAQDMTRLETGLRLEGIWPTPPNAPPPSAISRPAGASPTMPLSPVPSTAATT